jgi:hypothetical protein
MGVNVLRTGMISLIESQMETMKEALNSLRQPKKDKSLKHAAKKLAKKSGTGGAGPSKAKPSSPKKTSKKRKAEDDIDGNMFTFEQKKELSETIQTLEGEKLERVIQIIHEGVPSIGEVNGIPVLTSTSLTECIYRIPKRSKSRSTRSHLTSSNSSGTSPSVPNTLHRNRSKAIVTWLLLVASRRKRWTSQRRQPRSKRCRRNLISLILALVRRLPLLLLRRRMLGRTTIVSRVLTLIVGVGAIRGVSRTECVGVARVRG